MIGQGVKARTLTESQMGFRVKASSWIEKAFIIGSASANFAIRFSLRLSRSRNCSASNEGATDVI